MALELVLSPVLWISFIGGITLQHSSIPQQLLQWVYSSKCKATEKLLSVSEDLQSTAEGMQKGAVDPG